MNKMRKVLAILLCLVMCVTMLPTWAMGEDAEAVEPFSEESAAEMLQEEPADNWQESGKEPEPEEVVQAAYEYEQAEPIVEEPEYDPVEDALPPQAEVWVEETLISEAENEEAGTEEYELLPVPEDDAEQEEIELVMMPAEEEIMLQAEEIETENEETADLMKTYVGMYGNLTWVRDDEGTLTIYGKGEMKSSSGDTALWYGDSTIKKLIINDGVTSIGDEAFYECSNLADVTIPSSVSSIGRMAFTSCRSLTNVTISSSVSSIGEWAFAGCSSLTSFDIPSDMTSIAAHMFEGCSNLTDVTIPSSVTSIESRAFYGCSKLPYLTIPQSVRSIGERAFQSCKGLSSLIIPSYVNSVGDEAFSGCTGLTKVTINGVVNMGKAVFSKCGQLKTAGPVGSDCNIEYPEMDWIPENMLNGCNTLESVIIPSCVGGIGNAAFYGCSSLETVFYDGEGLDWEHIAIEENNDPLLNAQIKYNYLDYLDSLDSGVCGKKITWGLRKNGTIFITGSGEMYDYSSDNPVPWSDYLDSILSVEIRNGVTSIGSMAFSGCKKLSSVSFPDSLTTVRDEAFSKSGLISIVIPDSICTLGRGVFFNCYRLQRVVWSDSLREIPYGTFAICSALNDISIPIGLITIGEHAFQRCTALERITLPESLTTIENGAFAGSGLTFVKLPNGVQTLGEGAFLDCGSLKTVYLSENLNSIPPRVFGKDSSLTNVSIPEGLRIIGEQAFSNCSSLEGIVLPEGLTTIEKGAFFQTGLTAVAMPDSVQSLGDGVFQDCESLKTVYLSENLDSIPFQAFGNDSSLTSVSIPEGLRIIGEQSFSNCSSLKSIALPESLTTIQDSAFFRSGLASVEIPDSVSKLGSSVFLECSSLIKAVLPNQLKQIPEYTFSGCTCLSSIDIPKEVTSIGLAAFAKCSGLKSILLPDSVVTLETNSFAWSGLTSCTIPEYVESIGDGAFGACGKLSTIRIPASVLSIGEEAFSARISLKDIRFMGNAPSIAGASFKNVVANVYYPAGYSWYAENRLNYGGSLTWHSFAMIELGQKELTMQVNSREILSVRLTGGMTMTDVRWNSSDPDVATVSQEGVVSATSEGSTTITATLPESDVTASCVVSVIRMEGERTLDSGECAKGLQWVLKEKNDGATELVLTVTDPTGKATIEGAPWQTYSEQITDIVIPNGVTAIRGGAFAGCTRLTEITIPSSVTEIGENAFSNCNSLTGVKYIGTEKTWTETEISAGNEALTENKLTYLSCEDLEQEHIAEEVVRENEVAATKESEGSYDAVIYCHVCQKELSRESVIVPKLPVNYVLNRTELELVAGETQQLRVMDGDTGKAVTTTGLFIWSSADREVAEVTNGIVQGVRPGSTVVTVRKAEGDYEGRCFVRVLFEDVADSESYFYNPVYWAAGNGITSGTSPTTFSPTRTCTRGQIVTFLWKAKGSPEPASLKNPFTDVSSGDYFFKPVLWAKENGITSGTSATTFSPGNPCTRGQIVTFLWNAMGRPEPTNQNNPFTDVTPDNYFFKPVLWAKEKGITSGTTATTFSPGKACTRAQAMTFLYKAMN